jgi:hypothetical protein
MAWTLEMFASLARTARDPEAAEKAAALLNGELDPESVDETAAWIRQCYHRPSDAELMMHALDVVLDTYGVEPIRVEGAWIDSYHGDIIATYLNTGDAYTETVLLESDTGEFKLISWGDWLENWELEQETA